MVAACLERCTRSRALALGSLGFIALAALTGCSKPATECLDRSSALSRAMAANAGSQAQQRAYAAVDCDSEDIAARISSLQVADAATLQEELRVVTHDAFDAVRSAQIESSRLPLSSAHQQMYAKAAAAERAAGRDSLRAWATNPWAPLGPLDGPGPSTTGTLTAAAMRGERRAVALNLRSIWAEARAVRIDVALPGVDSGEVEIFRVNWTGNDRSSWAAAELEPLGDAHEPRETALLPGVTQQIWVQAHPRSDSQPGRFFGKVVVSAADGTAAPLEIPLDLQVFATLFPQRPTLHFGGWDYIDGADHGYAVTSTNSSELLAQLQAGYVDTPWAHRNVMHWNNVAPDGTLIGTLDATALERWMAAWPDARRFRVYLDVGDDISGIATGDAQFGPAVRAWAAAWAAAIRQLGRSEADFDLLLVDEPRSEAQARTTAQWARAIRESGAAFRIWTDPYWSRPSEVPGELIDAADTIAVNMLLVENGGPAYLEWAQRLAERGKKIEFYACDGPVRRLDPYAYFRLGVWRAHFAGASAVSFWSFVDTGGSPSDNEFAADDLSYSPLFIGPSVVRSGKQMEAAVQGIQDAAYLQMLANVATTHASESARQRAKDLLKQASDFLRKAPRSSQAQWRSQPDTSQLDRQQRQIGEFLDSLR
jgi:hypothetical protein